MNKEICLKCAYAAFGRKDILFCVKYTIDTFWNPHINETLLARGRIFHETFLPTRDCEYLLEHVLLDMD